MPTALHCSPSIVPPLCRWTRMFGKWHCDTWMTHGRGMRSRPSLQRGTLSPFRSIRKGRCGSHGLANRALHVPAPAGKISDRFRLCIFLGRFGPAPAILSPAVRASGFDAMCIRISFFHAGDLSPRQAFSVPTIHPNCHGHHKCLSLTKLLHVW